MQYHFETVEDTIGFCTENIDVPAYATVSVKIQTRGLYTSDTPEFFIYVDSICGLFLYPKKIFIDTVTQFLVIIHADQSADLYVNDFVVNIDILSKKGDMVPGEIIMHSDVADIRNVSFPHIRITETDKVVYCFKIGWRFGLFFDLMTRVSPPDLEIPARTEMLDIGEMGRAIAHIYRYLAYYQVFQILSSDTQYLAMLKDGWFPFVEILSGEYKEIGEVYKNKTNFENRIGAILNRFTEDRIRKITNKWWANPIFKEKQSILEAGINAYLQNAPDGYINAIKNLLTEIEGILRRIYHIEKLKGNRVKATELINHIIEKAKQKAGSSVSLFLPEYFLTYLKTIVFADFDVENGIVDLSRNSSSHGVASNQQYTRSRALQTIFILDQIYYYI